MFWDSVAIFFQDLWNSSRCFFLCSIGRNAFFSQAHEDHMIAYAPCSIQNVLGLDRLRVWPEFLQNYFVLLFKFRYEFFDAFFGLIGTHCCTLFWNFEIKILFNSLMIYSFPGYFTNWYLLMDLNNFWVRNSRSKKHFRKLVWNTKLNWFNMKIWWKMRKTIIVFTT